MNSGSQAPTEKQNGTQYVHLPARVFDNGTWFKLTPAAQNVYIQLRRFVNIAGKTEFTLPGLRARSHISARKTLHLALNELEKYGLLMDRMKAGKIAGLKRNAPKHTWYFFTDPRNG